MLVNLANIDHLILTLTSERKRCTSFYIVPPADKIVIYAVTLAETMRFPGIEQTKQKSSFARMTAPGSWFTTNLGRRS